MHLGIDFWKDFGGFLEAKWRHVGTKIEKSMPTSKSDFLKNRTLAAAGARFFRFGGSKLEVKTDQKSIKKWSQDGKASWHRFLMDFGGLLEASWEGKWSQDRSQEASKKRWKNGRHQDGQKIEKRRSDHPRGGGPEPWGGPPLQGGPNPWGPRSVPPGLAWPSGKAFKT